MMIVTKDRSSMMPHTWTYTVDPEEGDYTFSVLVVKDSHPNPERRGEILCVTHGDCDHAKAVRDHRAT